MTGPAPSHVVGVGASTAGLDALERFIAAVPSDTQMALVVVQQISPDQGGALAESLAKHTSLAVSTADDGTTIVAGHVYVIPGQHNLELRGGILVLTPRMDAAHPNYCIDQFFRSLAIDRAEKAIGVVLAGTGNDGAHGVTAIHAAGGFALAEDPEVASPGAMPQAAVASGAISGWGAARTLPAEILRHIGVLDRGANLPAHGIDRIITTVSRRIGVDFHVYKRATIGRRVARRRNATGSESLDDYAELLERSPDECDALGRDLLVGITSFFRDPEVFDAIRPTLSDIVTLASSRPDAVIRAWVPACSTGEEAYSVAIALCEAIEAIGANVSVKVFATDVNTDALAVAGRGRYSPSIEANVSGDRLRKFFTREPDGFVVRPFIRERIVFARHDVLRDPPFTRLDLLCCRNLLIYLDASAQQRATQVFRFGLRPGGHLLLGKSEALTDRSAFITVDTGAHLYATPPLQGDHEPRTASREPPTAAELPAPKRDANAWLLEQTLEHLGAPVLILSEERELVYAFGDIARVLRVPAERTRWKATDLLPDQAAAVVSSAIAQVQELKTSVVIEDLAIETPGGNYRGTLRAVPIEAPDGGGHAVALYIDSPWQPSDATALPLEEAVRSRIRQLEAELNRRQVQLLRAQEQLEMSTEELQATNEELVTSNEELQSANEELQSTNAELRAVNAELQFKVGELGQLGGDLQQVLGTVRDGLLFLDREGRIRRYNDAVLDVLPLVPRDEGRAIGEIAHGLVDVDLGREVRRVVQTQLGYEREVRSREGRTYSLSLQPFSEVDRGHEGVVVSLGDVSGVAEANARLRNYVRLLDLSPAPTVVASSSGGIEHMNVAFARLSGFDPRQLAGEPLSALLHPSNDPAALAAIERPPDGDPWSGMVRLRLADGSALAVEASVTSVTGHKGAPTLIALCCTVPSR